MSQKISPFRKFKHPLINFKKSRQTTFDFRSAFFSLFISFVFITLFLRLFHLTIVRGVYFRRLAEDNRIKEIEIEAPRGKIIDRKGFTLAYSKQDGAGSGKAEEKITTERIYPYGEITAHLLGYRQLASPQDLENDICQSRFRLNDKVGREGVERIYECLLRGERGKKLVEVDAKGEYLKTLSLVSPKEGSTLQLSLDLELQKKAYEQTRDKKVAVVATKPKTGELLVFLSSPSFNPETFEKNNQKEINNYLEGEEKPLFNRVTMGVYPPGSIFKLVVATGALEMEVIDQNFQVEDKGIIKAGPLTFGNWYFLQYGKTDGMVDVVKGIQRSNDIFFYKVGEKLGVEKTREWAEKLGLGQKTGIDLFEEQGLIPSPFWKSEVIGDRWYLGDTYNLSIGQGYLLTTPLQVNMATSVFANGGKLCKPKLLKVNSLEEKQSFLYEKDDQPDCSSLNLSTQTLDLVREGMRKACESGGTGWPFFDFSIEQKETPEVKNLKTSGVESVRMAVGCKTGTAESVSKDNPPHAWFTVFAPWDEPEVVLTVLVEEGGEGSYVAAPIAKEILKNYFEREE